MQAKLNTITDFKLNIRKVGTAGLAGMGGGVYVASVFSSSIGALVLGSLLAAFITGFSEYKWEKKEHQKYCADVKP